VFRTKIAIEKMQVGEVLTVLADDPASEDDISSHLFLISCFVVLKSI